MSDNVEHPSHYNAGGVETIEGIRAALGDGFSDYCLGNVLKYVWRCKHKGKLLEDLRKAAKYLEWAIEAAEGNCPVIPDSSSGKAISIPHGWRELKPDEVPEPTDMHEWMGGWFYRGTETTHQYKFHSSRHIRKIETENPSEIPNSSLPDPGPGYRLLSKDPPEDLQPGDEFWSSLRMKWWPSSADCGSVVQSKHDYYRRKIETTAWIPKVGDKVRVNYPRRTFDGKVGVIVEGNAGRYAVRLDSENFTAINLEAEHLELIEAAS